MATVTGTQGNDTLIGTAQADLLQGLGGNDLLDGGLGNDTMEGGDGDDTYVVRDNGDVITEGATEGANDLAFVDVVNFALSSGQTVGTYTASANVEAVSALEQAGTQAFNINAAASTRTVAGNAGANIITGAGTQSQTLIGLAGNDAYNVSSNTQIAQEAAGGGTDTLNVTLAAGGTAAERTYNLVAGSEIETINLLGTAAVSFTGNATVQTVNG
jgi:Ca2+-binding RTX toxin-like protein